MCELITMLLTASFFLIRVDNQTSTRYNGWQKIRISFQTDTRKEAANMTHEIYHMFTSIFPFVNREEKTAIDIINNAENTIFEKRDSHNELIGCAIVHKNTILLLVVDEKYRNRGIGSELLKQCEETILGSGYDNAVLGVGSDYLMPGVPTRKNMQKASMKIYVRK